MNYQYLISEMSGAFDWREYLNTTEGAIPISHYFTEVNQ